MSLFHRFRPWEVHGEHGETDAVRSGSRTGKTGVQRNQGLGVELQRNDYEETGVLKEKERKDRRREGGKNEKEIQTQTHTGQITDGLYDP